MKKLILSAAVLMSTVAAVQSEARSLQNQISAQLTKFDIQNASSLSDNRIKNGTISVDLLSKNITLSLEPAFHCPKGMMCAQVMPRPIVFQAGGLQMTTGSCNESIMTAMTDNRDVDGNLVRLTVVDNSNNTCRYFAPIASTEVQLDIVTTRDAQEAHRFEAGKLN